MRMESGKENDRDAEHVNIDEVVTKAQNAPTDTVSDVCEKVKSLDANRYATKKTVAQGMLDIALLTSNASQLKYVLQVGPKHEFYMPLVVLISISIVLQVAMGFVLLSLNLLRDCWFHKPRHRTSALNINYATTATAFIITVLNILVLSAVVAVALSCIFNINHQPDHRNAEILNNISLVFKVFSITVNIIISIFYTMQIDSDVSLLIP